MRRLFSSRTPWTQRADLFLVFLALLGLAIHTIAEETKRFHPQSYLGEKMSAATRTVRCFEAIRQYRLGSPASLDLENDPESTGLIGQEFTLITTDRGILEAKLTSVNPNFAAVFVQYFRELGLKPGDPVAFALTGSFPALNIAALAAADELGLRAIPIASVGASMWGANDPDFTWLDMESFLCAQGLLHARCVAASLGGSNDRGRGLSPKGRALLKAAVERNGVELISEPTVDQSIARRVAIYDREAGERGIRAYVNIGGGAASIGSSLNGSLIRAGVNRQLRPYNWTRRGALHRFASRGVPIIHVLRIESIARRHGFPVSPDSVPPVGEGEIFHREIYDLRIVIPAFATFLVLCFGVLRARQRAARVARELAVPVPSAGAIDERPAPAARITDAAVMKGSSG